MYMKLTSALRVAALVAVSATAAPADTTMSDGTVLSDTPTFIVTYIEVDPADMDKARALIKDQTTESQSEDGNLRFEGLQRVGQDNQFLILEAWSGPEARAAHAASDHTQMFRKDLEPMLYAPYDERPHVGLAAVDPASLPAGDSSTVYAVTHADIIPDEQFAPCGRQVDPNGPCGIELVKSLPDFGRDQDGNLRFDILTQSNRSNHMTIVEMWNGSDALMASENSAEKRAFRNQLSGIPSEGGVNADPQFVLNMLTGSLYDERLYTLIGN
ncbi:antibiotic biosynthesis monooxygenase [Pseudooceanicola algae]|uniref:(4S)-4-hydroxy-5-phosphonooxypentane-2,3-dione isomerase n=1 Tax=Pseudooceanicola algae TaxID=1537215 RepID=A0A418SGE8_9RHOB|nr:antibiotic biosynthesis monooxygenase [Pseudooceanicola algae]QPM91760.1 (4S)-4-hydroxy-5-phosphonooxypentane-2,3-dione isomerase [Pseudooceanicola algae]